MTLNQVFKESQIQLKLPVSGIHCGKPCSDVLISVRAVTASDNPFVPWMVELSPAIYVKRPLEVRDGAAWFSLPGDTMMNVAKSYFLSSYGFNMSRAFRKRWGSCMQLTSG